MKSLMPQIDSNDGLFHNGNPATGEQGTRVTDTWLNNLQDRVRDVQAEAHYVLQKAGFTPKAETQTQLYQAIVKIIDDNRKTASLTQKGETKLYTGYDSQSEDLALTPKTAYQLKQLIDSNTRALDNVIYNNLNTYSNKLNELINGFTATFYGSHYQGAEVYKIKQGHLMIIRMNIGVINQSDNYYLPESFDGGATAIAIDSGGGQNNVGAIFKGGNVVYIGINKGTNVSVIVIGVKN